MNWEFAIRYLKAVEKKHEGFFIANNLKILDCVAISGTRVIDIEIDRRYSSTGRHRGSLLQAEIFRYYLV